jgi:hypothetical protein
MALLRLNNPQSAIHNPQSIRPRRLRVTPAIRAMVRETELNAQDFIYPLFVRHGEGRTEIRWTKRCAKRNPPQRWESCL